MDTLHLFHELETLLRMDSRYCMDDGTLIKNNIVEDALNVNPKLIKHLLSHEGLKNNFFREVEGVLVFDKVKFQRFVMNKSFLADSYTSFKNKIGLTDENGRFISESREVVLSWPYKDCILEGGQTKEDAKRDEIMWNETLAPDEINRLTEPKVFTNFKRYDKDGEHNVEHLLPNDNLIIKGNNLLALHSLKKRFPKGVKLIYIDPPYNTGDDSFGYNDSFNHSTWLTFMKNRLDAACSTLSEDGVIFIQCDDHEQAYLKVLMDSVFGRDNFISNLSIKMSTLSGVKTTHRDKAILKEKEYGLIYKKGGAVKIEPEYIPDTEWDSEFQYVLLGKDTSKLSVIKLEDYLKQHNIPKDPENKQFQDFVKLHSDIIWRRAFIRGEMKTKSLAQPMTVLTQKSKDGRMLYYWGGRQMFFYSEKMHNYYTIDGVVNGPSVLLGDMWNDINSARIFNEGGVDFRNAKKPEQLLSRVIRMFSKEGDLVLDFFGGSGTTASVALKLKRQFITIEQIESQIELMNTRLSNVIKGDPTGISRAVNWQGGGSFVYCELAKSNVHFIDEIESAKTTAELKAIWDRMKATDYLNYKVLPSEIDANVTDFEALSLNDQKRFLTECLDKNLLYVPLSDIDSNEYAVSEEDKRLTREFYAKK